MKSNLLNPKNRDFLLVCFFILLSMGISLLPTGFEKPETERAIRCKAKVVAIDNEQVQRFGIVKSGDQAVELEILTGPFQGKVYKANNPLLGQMAMDKLFVEGDEAFVVLSLDSNGKVIFVNPVDHYRISLELMLLGLFALMLLLFGGWTGLKALVSFVFTALVLWKILVPSLLRGMDPVILTLGVTTGLCAAIILLVAGVTRKGFTALAGAFLGVLTSGVMAIYFTAELKIHGAVMPFAETLLFAGFNYLNLTKLYVAAVFLASSGAVMDIAMDVAASMHEVSERDPNITPVELMKSGFNVGRSVTGTMTTTLLLAYSGGYITLLMAFMAQSIPLSNTFNLIYVSSEIVKTLIGSFGLVMVAPFTAIVGGFIFTKSGKVKSHFHQMI
ncbi:YibE/F family protein [Desulfamplus magnetovallimortis]|uniref:YibE/F family protein n=1 Tax=Desulfamplus magnetovallimortis TaxID=1246637 RepID=A0A1W1HKB8_9BACT|nr:YibE/F family protein [Desulfamplus magnetovallimortis]SLM32900.1 YibE/F family protein [Desulfamplus magnetovallimortis]